MIYILPIEPYQERYSSWWLHHIPDRFKANAVNTHSIFGEMLSDKVESGTVLDAAGTNAYKASQISQIAKKFKENKIKPYDSFLVCDMWFPGLEAIPYMSHLYNIPVNIWGVWHAGSITNGDFAQPMHIWSKYFEMGWVNMCTGIFVGSEYSKESLLTRLCGNMITDESDEQIQHMVEKVHAFGMPLDWENIQSVKEAKAGEAKENIILFPHRPDDEKNPQMFFDAIESLSIIWDDFPDWKFVFCTSRESYHSNNAMINGRLAFLKEQFMNIEVCSNLTRNEYYELLHKSKIVASTTIEENFGYCVVEGAAFGCHIIAPDNFSHPEIFEGDYRILYKRDEFLNKLMKAASNPIKQADMVRYVEPYRYTVDEWAKKMLGR